MEIHTNKTASWSVPQCPFAIDYSARVLDDIRLAVMDAFFSLPRGGAEIGGVLLGSYVEGRLLITDYLPLPCEHATGPSFTLSARDEEALEKLLRSPDRRRRGSQAVGWYHSHTRSEIFLSDADLAIHDRYFPEPWQVALVLKPHTFRPMRAGFFFRGSDGAIQTASSCKVFEIEPLPLRPVPDAVPPATPHRMAHHGAGNVDPAVTVEVETIPPNAAETDGHLADTVAEPAPPDVDPDGTPVPKFLLAREERSWHWVKRLLAAATGVALGCIAFQTRDLWLYPTIALIHTPAGLGPGALGLIATETGGQMQIRWNPYAPKVRGASSGLIKILDGSVIPQGVSLDADHLLSGTFSYSRQSERVDVTLDLEQPDGRKVHESTTFLGQKPVLPAGALADRVKQLEADLAAQVARNQALQKDLADARARLRGLPRKRLPNPPAQQQ